jgi:hypothetical protein
VKKEIKNNISKGLNPLKTWKIQRVICCNMSNTLTKKKIVGTPLLAWARKKINLCELWILNKKNDMVSLKERSSKIIVAHG